MKGKRQSGPGLYTQKNTEIEKQNQDFGAIKVSKHYATVKDSF